MIAAVRVEALKLLRSPVGLIAAGATVGGIALLTGGMLLAAATGDAQTVAKLGDAATPDWHGITATAAQITAAGGLVAFGVVVAWLFAREFADGTVTGLFGLPIGRGALAVSKLVVFVGWAVAVSLATAVALVIVGLVSGYGLPDPTTWAALGRQIVLGILTAVLALPVAWVASATRSLLAGVAATIGLVVIAQVGVIAGAGGWMPLAAPALWAMSSGAAVTPLQICAALGLGAAFAGLTTLTWHRLQLDR